MPALAADITDLDYGSQDFVLHVHVVRVNYAALKIGIDRSDGCGRAWGKIERRAQAGTAGIVYRTRKRRVRCQPRIRIYDVGYRLIIINTRSAADHGLSFA